MCFRTGFADFWALPVNLSAAAISQGPTQNVEIVGSSVLRYLNMNGSVELTNSRDGRNVKVLLMFFERRCSRM